MPPTRSVGGRSASGSRSWSGQEEQLLLSPLTLCGAGGGEWCPANLPTKVFPSSALLSGKFLLPSSSCCIAQRARARVTVGTGSPLAVSGNSTWSDSLLHTAEVRQRRWGRALRNLLLVQGAGSSSAGPHLASRAWAQSRLSARKRTASLGDA